MEWIFWAIVGAAVIHVAEEYFGGFLEWFPRFSGLNITVERFVLVNALFIILCVAAALVPEREIVFRLSVPALIFINACIHIVGTMRFRRYSPGLVSALLLYVPLALYAFSAAASAGRLTLSNGVGAFALGIVWHAVPLVFAILSPGR